MINQSIFSRKLRHVKSVCFCLVIFKCKQLQQKMFEHASLSHGLKYYSLLLHFAVFIKIKYFLRRDISRWCEKRCRKLYLEGGLSRVRAIQTKRAQSFSSLALHSKYYKCCWEENRLNIAMKTADILYLSLHYWYLQERHAHSFLVMLTKSICGRCST